PATCWPTATARWSWPRRRCTATSSRSGSQPRSWPAPRSCARWCCRPARRRPPPAPPRPDVWLITVSASYGAGGSVVAPALAGRLGLLFLQRVTTSEGHLAQPGPCDEQLTEEEVKATPVHRLLAHFTQAMPA